MIPGLDEMTLRDLQDLGDIGKALEDIGETQKQIASLPCSLHPERPIVALAPTREHTRLCQECFDALMKDISDGKTTAHIRRLGEDAHGPGVDAAGLGKDLAHGARKEPEPRNEELHRADHVGDSGGLWFWDLCPQELINELPTMSMQELRVVRNALLLLRTEKKDEPQDPNK